MCMHLGPNYIQPGKRGEFQRTVQKQNFLTRGTAFSRCPMSKFLTCVISCKWTLGKTPRNIPAVCSRLVKRIQTRSLYLGFVLCLSVLSSPNLTLQRFVLFVFEQRLGIVCGNSLGLYHHGLLNIRFYPFFLEFIIK